MFLVESDFVTGETIRVDGGKAREVMAASMWDPSLRASFGERVKKLNPETKPGWKFNASAMLAHLNDSYHVCAPAS
jgi:hypothetical protein